MKSLNLVALSMVAVIACGTGCLNSTKVLLGRFSYDVKSLDSDSTIYPAVVLGGGCAGLTAAVYLSQAGYKPLVVQGETPGGLITQSHSVRNWPGLLDIPGEKIHELLQKHAQISGAKLANEKVIAVDFKQWPYLLTLQDCVDAQKIRTIKALGCIVAMGTSSNYLGIPGEQEHWGNGVTNCAVCDGSLYANKVVAVVGGGDAAITEASYLANLASKVYIIVRKDKLRAVDRRKEEVLARPNVEVLYNSEIKEVKGTTRNGVGRSVTHIQVFNNSLNSSRDLPVDGLFLAIGSKPNSTLFNSQLTLDKFGYIELVKHQQTSMPGVFAAGDICDPYFKQAISGAGDACKAAIQLTKFLEAAGATPALFGGNNAIIPKAKIALSEPAPAVVHKGPQLIEIKDSQSFNDLIALPGAKVVDFFATWCGPCKRMMPIVHNAAERFPDVQFLIVDIDRVPELAQKYGVQGVPTYLFIDAQGRERQRFVGGRDSITFEAEVKNIS